MKKGTRRGISILLMVMMLCALLVPSVLQASQSSQVEEWIIRDCYDYEDKMFVAPSGELYLSIYGGLAKYDTGGTLEYEFFQDPNCADGPYSFIDSFTVDSEGTIFFSDSREEGIRKMLPEDLSTSELIIPDSVMPVGGTSTDINLDAQGNFFIARHGTFAKHNSQGALLWTTPIGGYPNAATNPDGLSYIVCGSTGSTTVYVVDTSGISHTITLSDQGGRTIKPNSVALDTLGNVYVTETTGRYDINYATNSLHTKVFVFDSSGNYLASWDLPKSSSYDVGVDPEGNIYVFAQTSKNGAFGRSENQNIVYRIIPKASYTVEYYVGAVDGSGYLLGSSTFEDQSVGTPVTLTGGYGKGELNYMRPANEYSEGAQQGTVPKKLSIGDDNTIKVLYSKL